ncbi:ABC transporter ATP-binding protein [Polyangium spumosum]|uniref:ATP-binding cassette domain-containing protein n=1 Tax=Polyangium spumosum TaxID=889282 RepID=A0A6N7PU48_9BACT|nr:ABC transporter ATP-binding protein [Polyangium spumosum]MRG93785.1 ATP-binding cassette domain-containing protein [Polyangium spumosum]
MTKTHAIELSGLTKRFGGVTAVDDVTFFVEPGEVFGFMGHNGAGKTTTLRMLLGLTPLTSGSARVLGREVGQETLEVRRTAGYLPAHYTLPPDMTARQFLQYVGAMFALPRDVITERAEALLRRFDLVRDADRALRGFSTGMAQKVGLAQALINEPRVLLLDEPTSGLDPLGRHELLELLRELARDRGVTVLFSSHILSDVEALCRHVAVLHRARLVAFGDVEELKDRHGARTMDDLYLALVRKEAA